MPELPEVESVRRQLVGELPGRRIVDVWWDDHPQQRFSDVDRARGRRITAVDRRGKYLLAPLLRAGAQSPTGTPELELILHLGMTGSLRFDTGGPAAAGADTATEQAATEQAATEQAATENAATENAATEHDRARFHLDDGRQLILRDPRRFGRVSVVAAGDYADIPTLAEMGPEPLSGDFDADRFAAELRRTRATVKAALLSQRLVAGVGNIYADEALWHSRIHPRSRRIGPGRAHRLHESLRTVLAAAVEREGTSFRDYEMVNGEPGRYAELLDAYGRAGRPCNRCGRTLRKITVAQRGTTYCPGCQHV